MTQVWLAPSGATGKRNQFSFKLTAPMALQAGNRTYYNPTHGIEWRGNNLPYNTFYAIMCLFLFFFMAFVFRMCYKAYRHEMRLAERKQIQAK